MNTPKRKFHIPLYLRILIGMIIGIGFGAAASLIPEGDIFIRYWVYPWGRLFIRLLQLIAIPLVLISLIKGVTGLKDIRKLSVLGGKTIGIYLITTSIAVCIGLSVGSIVQPGKIINQEKIIQLKSQYEENQKKNKELAEKTKEKEPLSFLNEIVPENIFYAMGNNRNMLQIIFFAILFGIAILSIPKEKTVSIKRLLDSLDLVILKIVDFIIKVAPWGVATLMAGTIIDFNNDWSMFGALGIYALSVIVAMFILLFGLYPLMVHFFTKIHIRNFIRTMYPVQLLAFTTSSSSSTLPVTMETVEKKLNVSEEVTSFVLPVGTTINMDGTSCYQAIAILFIAQITGIELGFSALFTILVMTIISSIGTPGIPGGSYVILTMVLSSVGIPAEGLALILGIDRPLDMLRTSVNVTGDAAVATIIEQIKNKQEKK